MAAAIQNHRLSAPVTASRAVAVTTMSTNAATTAHPCQVVGVAP